MTCERLRRRPRTRLNSPWVADLHRRARLRQYHVGHPIGHPVACAICKEAGGRGCRLLPFRLPGARSQSFTCAWSSCSSLHYIIITRIYRIFLIVSLPLFLRLPKRGGTQGGDNYFQKPGNRLRLIPPPSIRLVDRNGNDSSPLIPKNFLDAVTLSEICRTCCACATRRIELSDRMTASRYARIYFAYVVEPSVIDRGSFPRSTRKLKLLGMDHRLTPHSSYLCVALSCVFVGAAITNVDRY